MATVRDVASKAGVSVGTVSRVLTGNVSVKPHLRERVINAMDELSYKPNLAARALRTNRIDVIGVLVPDITTPFFAELARSIDREAGRYDHTVMLANTADSPELEARQLAALEDRSPRAIIVAATARSDVRAPARVPIVSINRMFGDTPLVTSDNVGGAAAAAQHLLDLGHERIAYLAGPRDNDVAILRKRGFVDRIAKFQRSRRVSLEALWSEYSFESGELLARILLDRASALRPTAIAAASDEIAIGALRAARSLRIQVPEELSIIGFDDIRLARMVVPSLSTIRQDTELLARTALAHVFGENKADAGDTMLSCELVKRDSTAPSPAR